MKNNNNNNKKANYCWNKVMIIRIFHKLIKKITIIIVVKIKL